MLPAKLPKPPKRSSRWRSQAHCSFVRSHRCCVPECPDLPIEVAHIRVGGGAGMGQKPSDFYTVSLCRFHHSEQHRVGERTFAIRHGIDLAALAEEFCRASPKWPEIRAAKQEAGQ